MVVDVLVCEYVIFVSVVMYGVFYFAGFCLYCGCSLVFVVVYAF